MAKKKNLKYAKDLNRHLSKNKQTNKHKWPANMKDAQIISH